MADIERLKQLLAADSRFKGLAPDDIFAVGSVEDQPIPAPPVKTHLTTWEAAGLGAVTIDDIKAALAPPPKQYRSPEGAPGSWHVQPEADKVRLFWDSKPQPDAPLFASVDEAEAWQKQWYDDNPPIEIVKAEAIEEVAAIEVKP